MISTKTAALISFPLSVGLAYMVYYGFQCHADICYHLTQTPSVAPAQLVGMAVFYSSIALVLLVLAISRKSSSVRSVLSARLVNDFKITFGESLILTLIVFLFVFHFSIHLAEVMRNEEIFSLSGIFPRLQVYDATILTGRVLDLNLGLIILAAGKDAVQSLSGVPFGSLIPYHRVLGWIYVFIAILHTIAYIWTLGLDPVESFGDHMSYLTMVIRAQSMGFYGTLIAVPAVIAAIPWMRRRHYNLFTYSHSLLYGPSFVLLCFHVTSVFYYALPGILLILIDRCVRIYASLSIVNSRLVGPRFIIVEIDTSSRPEFADANSGQYVRILVKQVSNLEWHTFSIFNTHRDPKTGKTITSLFIDTTGDWCNQLKRVLLDTNQVFLPQVAVCGPYGSESLDKELEGENVVICLAAGSGVSPCHSLARKHPSAKMYWSLKEYDADDESIEATFSGLQVMYHTTGFKRECKVDSPGEKGNSLFRDSGKVRFAVDDSSLQPHEGTVYEEVATVDEETLSTKYSDNGSISTVVNPVVTTAENSDSQTGSEDVIVLIPEEHETEEFRTSKLISNDIHAPLVVGIPASRERRDSGYGISPMRLSFPLSSLNEVTKRFERF